LAYHHKIALLENACWRHRRRRLVGRKGQQVVVPGRDNPLAAGKEGTFSKTLLFEK
jgi:hypothetical protein